MKHKIIKLAIAGAIAIVGTIGYNFTVNQNDANFQFAIDNVEALARGEGSGGGVEDCDITIYNRNEAEASTIKEIQSSIGGGFYIVVDGKRIDLGIGGHAGGSVKYYYCKVSPGNCCKKTWMQKPVEYL